MTRMTDLLMRAWRASADPGRVALVMAHITDSPTVPNSLRMHYTAYENGPSIGLLGPFDPREGAGYRGTIAPLCARSPIGSSTRSIALSSVP